MTRSETATNGGPWGGRAVRQRRRVEVFTRSQAARSRVEYQALARRNDWLSSRTKGHRPQSATCFSGGSFRHGSAPGGTGVGERLRRRVDTATQKTGIGRRLGQNGHRWCVGAGGGGDRVAARGPPGRGPMAPRGRPGRRPALVGLTGARRLPFPLVGRWRLGREGRSAASASRPWPPSKAGGSCGSSAAAPTASPTW